MRKKSERKIVITGLGLVCSAGIGKESVWESILKATTGLTFTNEHLDSKYAERFFLHKVKNFDITKFNINKQCMSELIGWKGGKVGYDLLYLIAAIKLALNDRNSDESLGISTGLVIANENLGFGDFYKSVIDCSYNLLSPGSFHGNNIDYVLNC